MYDIFIEPTDDISKVKVSDYGMTLMRLSYTYDIDTPMRERILNRIVNANHLDILNGVIFVIADLEKVYTAIMLLSQVIGKVSNMKLFQRETVNSLFFEQLSTFIEEELDEYYPIKGYHPIPDNPEYEVNYCFNHRQRPLFLFAVNNPSNAKLATISCLKFINEGIKFKSIIVLENLESITKKDLNRLLSVSDKNFPSLKDFKENAHSFFEREEENLVN